MNFGRSADPFGFGSVEQDVGIGLQQGFVIDSQGPLFYDAASGDGERQQSDGERQQGDGERQQGDGERQQGDGERQQGDGEEATVADPAPTLQQSDEFSIEFAAGQQPTVDLLQELRQQRGAAGQSEDSDAANEVPDVAVGQSEPGPAARPELRRTLDQSDMAEPSDGQQGLEAPSLDQSEPGKPSIDQSALSKTSFDQSEPSKDSFDQSEPSKPSFDQSEPSKPSFDQSEPSKDSFDQSEPSKPSFDQSEVAIDSRLQQTDEDADSDVEEAEASTETPPTVAEAVSHFEQSGVLSAHRAGIEPTIAYSGFAALRRLLCGPPRLRAELRDRRDFIFCLASCQFDNSQPMHSRMLAAVYRGLHCDSGKACPRFGSHWESIGFQGDDPSTDLRGCGMLGLLCLLHLVSEPRLQQLRDAAFRVSNDARQNFPFCVMSINLTRVALVALRRESLNRMINDTGDPLATFLRVHSCLLRRLHRVWVDGDKTIMDSGFVVRDLEAACVKDAAGLVRDSAADAGVRDAERQRERQQDREFVDLCAEGLAN